MKTFDFYAARSSAAFDEIYGRNIDVRFYGGYATDILGFWREKLLNATEQENKEM